MNHQEKLKLILLVTFSGVLFLSQHREFALVGYDDGYGWLRRLQTGDDNDLPTILPTIITTDNPTSPTSMPSIQPSSYPSIFSMDPSASPSIAPSSPPTNSRSPSKSPSSSPNPTKSQVPSATYLPSSAPTSTPSEEPSSFPSIHPSPFPSAAPSNAPTTSARPSLAPSYTPTHYPTISSQPSLNPTVTFSPTVTRSPTGRPSNEPTLFPTFSPSDQPTPRPPTERPSKSPTERPSVSPSNFPSTVPSLLPTLSVGPLFGSIITMMIEGIPRTLDMTQLELWQNITSDHVFDYYQKYNDFEAGIIPVNVSSVNTTFKQQLLRQNDGILEIEYEQTIVLGRYRPIENEDMLFVVPFVDNTQDYVIDLLTLLDLESIITLKSVIVGKSLTASQEQQDGISSVALTGISISIVLTACFIVIFLFWKRERKNTARNAKREENSDVHEGAQPEEDGWTNTGRVPFPPTPPRPGYSSAPITPNSNYQGNGTLRTDPNFSARSDDYSHEPHSTNRRHVSQHSTGSRFGNVPTISMRPTFFGKSQGQQFRTESEITKSEGRPPSDISDSGFILEPPTLPSVDDNLGRFRGHDSTEVESNFFSPLHIPDDEEGVQAPFPVESSQVLGLSRSHSSPSLLGFDMMVQELE